MNKIYIVDYLDDYEVDLNFKNNNFCHNDIFYNFNIISIDKIIIYKDNQEETYYTEDSYIYYINFDLKNKIRKSISFFKLHVSLINSTS